MTAKHKRTFYLAPHTVRDLEALRVARIGQGLPRQQCSYSAIVADAIARVGVVIPKRSR